MGTLIFRSLLLFTLLLVWASCDQGAQTSVDESWGQVQPLFQRQQKLRCAMDSLQRQASSLWDGVVDQLAAELPPNLPVDERRNILAVRNRDLIQMFMVYDSLQPSLRQHVELAGEQDSLLAVAMKANNAEAEAITYTLDSTLMALKPQLSSAAFRALTERLTTGSDKNAAPPCAN